VDTLKVLGGSLALMLLLVTFVFGTQPMMEAIYALHMWPRPSAEQVQTVMKRGSGFASLVCRNGEKGWEYICEGTSTAGTAYRYGVMAGVYPVVRSTKQLPPEGPVPERNAFLASESDRLEAQRKWLALIDLNNAREDQLVALGVDPQLAGRIILRRFEKRYATVDDLLTIEGVDRPLLERLRPHVRVGLNPAEPRRTP
jgi:Helix-hairpin-helix motif